MKAIVLAYHNIGCAGIRALIKHGYEIAAVFTHQDDPSENLWFESVAELAASLGIEVHAPEDINHPLWVERIRNMAPDIMFSFYYRNMVKAEVLSLPSKGCLNLHGSLLPKYRGRCPVNWALLHGETETGVTLHHMVVKPDAGDIVGQERLAISDDDTAHTLHQKMTAKAASLLDATLPLIKNGTAQRIPQDPAKASYFGGRKPADGEIDWTRTATEVRNLVRAVTRPYPGAFSFIGNRKLMVWSASVVAGMTGEIPGTVLSANPLIIACGEQALRVEAGQGDGGVFINGGQLAAELNLVEGMRLSGRTALQVERERKKKVLILGVDGFIGNHLSERLLDSGRYEVYGMDLSSSSIGRLLNRPDFNFREGDISIHREWIEYHVRKCDIILPLVAIATPAVYVKDPLRVFELDFEENLRIVRYCAKYNKRILFPSTSEVYGMSQDPEFNEQESNLVLGPIRKQRWIYSCSKQMLDRVIWAYGTTRGLRFTLFRPFNWVGARLDRLESARIGSSRVITQLILNLVEGTPIRLVDGGLQKRCFTDVKDGVECLYKIIENKDDCCDGKIFNIGNPENEASILELAETLVAKFEAHPLRHKFPPFAGFRAIEARTFYGSGYQDVQHRRPSIKAARTTLGWSPTVPLAQSVEETLDFFLQQAIEEGHVQG